MKNKTEELRVFLALYKEHLGNTLPQRSQTLLGEKYHVSRERVRQILKSMSFIPQHIVQKAAYKKPCLICQKIVQISSPKVIRVFCSLDHKNAWIKETYYTTTSCKMCGKSILCLKSFQKNKTQPIFCSKTFQGAYLGKNITHEKKTSYWRMLWEHPEKSKQILPKRFCVDDVRKYFDMSKGYSYQIVCELLMEKKILFQEKKGKTKYYERL